MFGPDEDFRLDLDHMCGVFMLEQLPSCVEEGTTSTLTDTGRTLAIISLGEGRSAPFFGYCTDQPMQELAEGPAAVLPRWLRDLPLRFASYGPVSSLLQRRLQLKA